LRLRNRQVKGKSVIQKRSAGKRPAERPSPESSTRPIGAAGSKPDDWRRKALAHIDALIKQVAPDAVQEPKWKKPSNPAGVPVWSQNGIICTCETYKDKVKLTFARGAALKDPSHLFNSSLEGNARRAIDIREDERIDEEAFKALVCAAVALNTSRVGK
jgi:hypothetical protein